MTKQTKSREAEAIKKIDASALLAQEQIIEAAGRAQKVIDDARVVATAALERIGADLRYDPPSNLRKQPILVVNDDDPLLASIKQMLELAGYRADLTRTAHEALLRSKKHTYKLALIAMVLPDMQGLELLEPLRVNIPNIRIIMVSSDVNAENATKSLNLGVNGYLTTPVNPEELLGIVETNFDQIQKEAQTRAENQAVLSLLRKKEVEIRELQLNSTFFETLLTESPTACFFVDSEGTIVFVNKRAQELLGYKRDELVGNRLSTLAANQEQLTKITDEQNIQSTFFRKDGAEMPVGAHIAEQYYKDGNKGFFITLHDLSKTRGLPIDPTTFAPAITKNPYSLEQGYIFLAEEETPEKSAKIFEDFINNGSQGLLISRRNPSQRDKTLEQTPSIWLTQNKRVAENCIAPDELTKLYKTIENFIAKAEDGVIFFEGFEYLLVQNGFPPMLKFFQSLTDLVMVSPSRVILTLDPLALDAQEMHLFKKDMRIIPG